MLMDWISSLAKFGYTVYCKLQCSLVEETTSFFRWFYEKICVIYTQALVNQSLAPYKKQ